MKYKIGDKVWYAQRRSVEKTEQCPDCFGKKFLTVIKGDGAQVTIDCVGCQCGYEPPRGYIRYWSQETDVAEITIQGLDVRQFEEPEYRFNVSSCSWNTAKENKLFDNKEGAEKRAIELAEEHNREELARIHRKEKNNRTWSWNAHYHRSEIKRAEQELAYHKSKLDVARKYDKEDKAQHQPS